MVDARAHDDHGPPLGDLRVARELACHARGDRRRDAREPLLPGGRVGLARVVVARRPLAGQVRPGDAVLGQEEVIDRRHQVLADTLYRHAAPQHVDLRPVEARQKDLDRFTVGGEQRQLRIDVAEIEVPVALTRRRPAVAQRTVGHRRLAGRRVHDHGLPLRRLDRLSEVVGGQEAVGRVGAAVLAQRDQEGHVGVCLRVAREERHVAVDVELLEDDVAHGKREGAVHARRHRQPVVGELDVLGVVGGNDHDLLPGIARLDHEVGVGGARDRHVAAPDHEVRGMPPVCGFGHVGLVPEGLRRRRRQICVPVVERVLRAAGERHVPRARGVRDGRHRRDRAHAGHAVGAPALDRVDVRRSAELEGFLPGRAHEAAVPARVLVGLALRRIRRDARPGVDGVGMLLPRLPPHLQQGATHVGVAHAPGLVGVPGEGGAPRAAPGLHVRHVGGSLRIVGRLGLPGDDAVPHVDHPGAGARAVDAVGGAHLAVVAPAVAVELLGTAVTLAYDDSAILAGLAGSQVAEPTEQRSGGLAPFSTVAPCGPSPPLPAASRPSASSGVQLALLVNGREESLRLGSAVVPLSWINAHPGGQRVNDSSTGYISVRPRTPLEHSFRPDERSRRNGGL